MAGVLELPDALWFEEVDRKLGYPLVGGRTWDGTWGINYTRRDGYKCIAIDEFAWNGTPRLGAAPLSGNPMFHDPESNPIPNEPQ